VGWFDGNRKATEKSKITKPFGKSALIYLNETANEISKEYPKSKFSAKQIEETNVTKISLEGLQIAKEYAYSDINPSESPSSDYINSRYEIIKQQIALSGYRLAEFIKTYVK